MRNLYIFTGAGLSAESGLRTFRGNQGLWDDENLDIVCNYLTWKTHRERVFDFYNARKADVQAAVPNEAHQWIAEWQRTWGEDRVRVLTQNVDDLLERAGTTAVTHLHGELSKAHCTACDTRWPVDGAFDVMGRCPKCGSLRGVKPGIVMFHERAPEYLELGRLSKSIKATDILLVIGTAFEVIPAAVAVPRQKVGHALTWQINPIPEETTYFGESLAMGASAGCALLAPKIALLMAAASDA